ncbi:succinyl-diaminopimelate desuccinylase [Streptantibioticus rubrisoli]|uniref:Succinyl-diaminopimelate desuccinylase n=1 Tax=Streptantibioticus rubrisoli TaxID=1387313 RepID=A0ABT1P928_9ACTN|nr:succinyl-diaminopimelate desuccinylase [Streptantibioticus rubrisoli]MCQ4041311.1 succinyl-diaminopimelate desuccinylase [Streptantibioticus rubrisoli]
MTSTATTTREHHRVLHSTDLLELTDGLVAIRSVSGNERELADLVERRLLDRAPDLTVRRIGNNVIARTGKGAQQRIVLAGHLDTVPEFPPGSRATNGAPETVRGLGAVDMKGGVAVMLALAERAKDSGFDLTFLFYDKEEIGSRRSETNLLLTDYPYLLGGDLAILLEPTNGRVEAGCQGNLVVDLGFDGVRAHTARPWQGVNAIHRAAVALARISGFVPEPVDIDGLVYRQALCVVGVDGGVQGDVVPDHCSVRVNYRHAPTLDSAAALDVVTGLAPEADRVRVVLSSPPAPPALAHPLVAQACAAAGGEIKPRLGWSDVGRFAAHGIPAINFGPGDPELAHTPREFVSRDALETCYTALLAFLAHGAERPIR